MKSEAGVVGADWDLEADVVVIGIGAAGSAAAIEAHDRGASVIVLEKMPAGREGGNTRVSGGIWFDNTDPAGAATYLRSLCGRYTVPDDVVEVWAEETHKNSAWVESLGVAVAHHADYQPEYPELAGSESFGGYLGVDGVMGQSRLFEALTGAVRSRGIEVRLATPARELVKDPSSGEILGVEAASEGASLRVRARRGVVLATGGFENNQEMVRDYLGLEDPAVWGSPAATGDGIKMAQKVGADLWHMNNMMSFFGLKVPGWESAFPIMFMFATSYVYVGLDGRRFVDETVATRHGHAYMYGRYELYPTKPMHVVFDERARLAGPLSPTLETLPVGWNLLVEKYQWSADNSVEIEKGWIKRADTLEQLAAELGVPADSLGTTIARYNESCAAGADDNFGRDPNTLVPLDQPPFYGFTWGPVIGWSNGGPRRNHHAQVLDAFGAVIPRLYAAGNVSSTYSWCKDGGFHIADALAFGRIAGRTAAAEPPHP